MKRDDRSIHAGLKPLTVSDRLVYGAIAAAFGVLLGLGASLCLLFAVHEGLPFRWIVLASAAYFFFVGAARGPDAAFFTGEAITAVGGVALAEAGAIPGTERNSSRWGSWSSPVLLLVWIAIVGVLAWKA